MKKFFLKDMTTIATILVIIASIVIFALVKTERNMMKKRRELTSQGWTRPVTQEEVVSYVKANGMTLEEFLIPIYYGDKK